MKHEVKVTILLLAMFVITQFIGLYVIDAYTPKISTEIVNGTSVNVTIPNDLPYGLQPPPVQPQLSFATIIISFVIAIFIFFLLTRIRANVLLKVWFTAVVYICLSVALYAFILKLLPEFNPYVLALILAVPLTFYKSIRPNMIVHNATELLIYPGLAAIFVPILIDNGTFLSDIFGISTIPIITSFFKVWPIIILLLLISLYDMWAVWKSTLMVNLAKYQINQLKVFTGFFVPYVPKGVKLVPANSRNLKKKMKKIKVAIALLGGGDVAFPLIFAGVVYRASGLMPSLIIIAGATVALALLFLYSKKGKFYPAMPFLTAGCLIAWAISLLI